MTIAAVIVAAGRGTRLGGDVPKQYRTIGGRMILARTIGALLDCGRIDRVVCVIDPDQRDLYDRAKAGLDPDRLLAPVAGGTDRAGSVLAGLAALEPLAPRRVLIHDAARPFVDVPLLEVLCAADGGAIPAEPVVDALWREADGAADSPVQRAGLWRAQTPQAFPFAAILAAHRAAKSGAQNGAAPALDDAETYRRAGGTVALVPGGPDNFKITTAADLARAERWATTETPMEFRTGQGFDVHRFGPGDAVWLCGLRIPHTHRLDGHSDADVGLHALADALYGALAEGDIGRHFPPTDPQWKGAESHVFLAHAAGLVAAAGGRIVNTDLTILAEAPKIAPHADAMRRSMGAIMRLDPARISVKATTMERMGFVGRNEGIGCLATATVALPVAP